MKLKKRALEKALLPVFEGLGYHFFPNTIDSFPGLFIKKIEGGLYLTAAGCIHRFYDDQFTIDLYLSRLADYNYLCFDVPRDSSKRIGDLLSDNERKQYFGDDSTNHWWSLYNDKPEEVLSILLKIVEPRFTGDQLLVDRIMKSKAEDHELRYVEEIIRRVDMMDFGYEFEFLPKELKDGISIEWYKSAEYVLKRRYSFDRVIYNNVNGGIIIFVPEVSNRTVMGYASSAYRKYILDTLSGTTTGTVG